MYKKIYSKWVIQSCPMLSKSPAGYKNEMYHLTYIRSLCEVQKYSRKTELCYLYMLANSAISIVLYPCVGPNTHNDIALLYNTCY